MSASPENLLEMQIFCLPPRPARSDTLGVGHGNLLSFPRSGTPITGPENLSSTCKGTTEKHHCFEPPNHGQQVLLSNRHVSYVRATLLSGERNNSHQPFLVWCRDEVWWRCELCHFMQEEWWILLIWLKKPYAGLSVSLVTALILGAWSYAYNSCNPFCTICYK